jgi:UDP-3-O-[3-hydroxymyristoyl] glucosamine N-acyltransferase
MTEADARQQPIAHIQTLSDAKTGSISFLSDKKYLKDLAETKASAVLIREADADQCPCVALVVKDPYLGFAKLSHFFDHRSAAEESHAVPNSAGYIHPHAIVDASSKIAPNCYVGKGAEISANCILEAGCYVGDYVTLGSGCRIGANSVIHHHTQIGSHSHIYSGAIIGAQGFGFAPDTSSGQLAWQPIAQLGRVIIGDHVYIGANTCVDRGALENTVIESNVIIDNLVMIAHNVHIGAGTAIAANTGIAGSTRIGKRCMIGGGVGIVGHITITDDVHLSGMSMVTGHIRQSGHYASGTSVQPVAEWRRSAVGFKKLAQFNPAQNSAVSDKVASLSQEVAELKRELNALINTDKRSI